MPSNMPSRLTPTVIGSALSAITGVVLGAGVAAYIIGTLQVRGAVNFTQNGTQTGAVLQVSGVSRIQTFPVTCTATGGLTSYSTCVARSPYTTTGALLGVSLECGNVAKQLKGDVSFKKTSTSATGTVLTNLDGITAGTGTLADSHLAQNVTWNPADLLTFTTLVTPTGTLNTTRYDCQMWSTTADKYGS